MTRGPDLLPLSETKTPTNAADVADIVRACHESKTPLYPIGGASALDYGVYPTRQGIGLDLSGLNRIVDHAADDLTITVEAGVTIAQLNAQLAQHDQWLPIDIPQAEQATIGGVVATAPSGPRRLHYGTMRDYVIGIKAVNGQGTPFSAGGRVVKNAAGYDLCRLLTGSLGTLGVITQVTLMVRPVPERSELVVCPMADLASGRVLLEDLMSRPTMPVAVELLSGAAWDAVAGLPALDEGSLGRLVVAYEGSEAEVGLAVEQLVKRWSKQHGLSSITLDAPSRSSLWQRMTEFPALPPEDGTLMDVEISFRSASIEAMKIHESLSRHDATHSLQTHVGDAILRVRCSADAGKVPKILSGKFRGILSNGGWTIVTRHAPQSPLDQKAVWGPPVAGMDVMRAIKDRFDPQDILNPGRFIF